MTINPLFCQRGSDGLIPAQLVDLDGLIGVELGYPQLAAKICQHRRHLGKSLHSQQMERDAERSQLAAQRIDLGQ